MKLFDIESWTFIFAVFYSIEVGDDGPSMYDGLCGLYVSRSIEPSPFSPSIVFPSCFIIMRRHFARAFWNQTWANPRNEKKKIFKKIALNVHAA